MNPLDIVKELEGKSKENRKKDLCLILNDFGIKYETQKYSTGENIFVPSGKSKEVGVGSHFDVVEKSPGANDNCSAIAVTIDVLRKIKDNPLENIGTRGFFFDEEEIGLIGSRDYIEKYGINDLLGIYNMELVGSGNILALWSVDNKQDTLLLKTLESEARKKGIQTIRFPRIIANTADHVSFRKKGLVDSFTITMITEEDFKTAQLCYHALNKGSPFEELGNLMGKAPVFKHYHKSSDTSEHLNNQTLETVSGLLYNSIQEIDKKYESDRIKKSKS